MIRNNRTGLGWVAIIGIIAVIIVLGISIFGRGGDENPATGNPADQASGLPSMPSRATGGTSLGVTNFTKAAYDSAVSAGKVIIVFFTSATCGKQCDTEIQQMKSAFTRYPERPIAGFIADINKDQAFANSLNIFGPDGKAVVINGNVETRTPLSWIESDYAKYIEIYTDGPEDYE